MTVYRCGNCDYIQIETEFGMCSECNYEELEKIENHHIEYISTLLDNGSVVIRELNDEYYFFLKLLDVIKVNYLILKVGDKVLIESVRDKEPDKQESLIRTGDDSE